MWKNTSNVVNWFNNIENKKDCSFIQFDIKEFYPSITEEILEEAISYAKSPIDIDDHKIRTIKHCSKSLLFYNNVAWKKLRQVVLTSPWAIMMALKYAN